MRGIRSGIGVSVLGVMLVLTGCSHVASARPPVAAVASQATVVTEGTQVAEAVLKQFKENGLPIGEQFVYTPSNDSNHLLGAAGQYVGKITFQDTRLTQHTHGAQLTVVDGGTIQVFPDQGAVKEAKHYLTSLNGDGAMFFTEYDYWNGVVLVRISSRLDPQQAGDYKAVLATVPTRNAVSGTGTATPSGPQG